MSGWNLTGRLVAAHFGALGTRIAEALASFDPETATAADRDNLVETIQQTAVELATARRNYDKEHGDVVALQKLIATDESIFDTLAKRLEEGTINEASVTLFCDSLEANKGRLATEVEEANQAKIFNDQVQQYMDSLSSKLADYDRRAKAALANFAQAQAAIKMEELRQQNQAALNSLTSITKSTSGLDALDRIAESTRAKAEGMRIVSEINQKPIDDAAAVDEIRRMATQPPAESVRDRLARLSAESKSKVA